MKTIDLATEADLMAPQYGRDGLGEGIEIPWNGGAAW